MQLLPFSGSISCWSVVLFYTFIYTDQGSCYAVLQKSVKFWKQFLEYSRFFKINLFWIFCQYVLTEEFQLSAFALLEFRIFFLLFLLFFYEALFCFGCLFKFILTWLRLAMHDYLNILCSFYLMCLCCLGWELACHWSIYFNAWFFLHESASWMSGNGDLTRCN